MKAHHFGILFTAIALVLFLFLDIKTSTVKAIISERNKINQSLTGAIDDGVNELAESYTNRELIGSKEDGVTTFFVSLYSSLDMVSDPVAQQKLRLYTPVIIVTDTDGIYVFYNDEYEVAGITNVAMRWSEKYPYSYEDECFIYSFTMNDTLKIYDKNHLITDSDENAYVELDYHEFQNSPEYQSFRTKYPDHFLLDDEEYYLVRKGVIIDLINTKMEYYINEHNTIAAQYGISYNFSLPAIDESDLLRSVEQPGMIVVFQGYPHQSTGETYNRVLVSGAQIYKEEVYYIEDKSWYKLYHKSSCSECETNSNVDTSVVYRSVGDCAAQGAYACEECCPEGVHVPDYLLD